MTNNGQPTIISIDTNTIIRTLAILGGIYLLFNLWGIVLIILAAFILSWALAPLVNKLEAKRLPRAVSLIGIYLILITIIVFLVSFTITPLVQEATDFGNNLPMLSRNLQPLIFKISKLNQKNSWFDASSLLSGASQAIQTSVNNLVDGIGNFFSGLLTIFLIMVITFYMVSEEQSMKKLIISLAPAHWRERALEISDQVQKKMGHWLIGQVFLCFVIFLFTYVALTILGVKYALLLSLVAGLAEAIPYLGPIFSAVPAIFVALTQSTLLAVLVAIMYLLIQQIENSVLVPTVMRQAVGLDPIISIIVLLVGYQLGGVLGAILAIPLATAIGVVISSRPKRQKTAVKRLLRA